ncbi:MAG: AAA family ATPase [Burkholderiales bacterium]
MTARLRPARSKSRMQSTRQIGLGAGDMGTVVRAAGVTFAQLAARLGKPKAGEKAGDWWTPAAIQAGRRCAERVQSVSYLAFDVEAEARVEDGVKRVIGEEPPHVDAMLAELALHGWRAALHTSFSHTAEHPRYRLVFDLSRPLQPTELRPLGLHVVALLGIHDCFDKGALEPARLYFLPRCPEERLPLFRCHTVDGSALPVDELLDAARREAEAAQAQPRRTGRSGNVIEAFCAAHDVAAIIEKHGYVPRGRRRWLWPGSTTGMPGVRLLDDGRVYSSHNGDLLNDGHAHDAFDCYRLLTHGGDMTVAVREAAKLLGLNGERRGNGEWRGEWHHAAAEAPEGMDTYPGEENAPEAQEAAQAAAEKVSEIWPDPIDLEALSEREPALPAFIMQDWLPCGYATLFAGHGGVGKSGIALHLACCVALGRPFFGMPVQQRNVLYLSCEDRQNVLHWRLSHICRHLGVSLADLRGRLDVLDLVGHDAILWQLDGRTGNALTPAFGALADRIGSTERQVVVADGITDTFGGNENSKSEVKRYVNALVGLIPADTGAVLLVGHVAKYGDSGYSGTTAWHNSSRARWYLFPEKEGGAEDGERTGSLLLELQKSNNGRTDQSMRFAWDEAARMFLGEQVTAEPTSNFDRKHRDRTERAGIMAALRASIAALGYVPAASTGNRTAYHVLKASDHFPEALKKEPEGRKRFWKHMEALQQSADVTRSGQRTPGRHVIETFEVRA